MSMSRGELFDGFLRQRTCRRCRRKLHSDKQRRYRTREAALCFRCLQEFERSPFWSFDTFIKHTPEAQASGNMGGGGK